jgi:hypothetical protein
VTESTVDSAGAAVLPSVLMQRRLVRRLLVIGLVIVALVGAYGAFTVIRDTLYTPDRPVRALFAALAERDEAAIRDVVGCSSPLCRPGALQSGYRPPEKFEVVKVEILSYTPDDPTRRPDTSLAAVSVRYTIDGVTYSNDVRVQRSASGLFREWHIAALPGAEIDVVSLTMAKARVAQVEVNTNKPPVSGFKAADAPFALPGTYMVTSVDDPLLSAATETVVVAGDVRRQQVDLKVAIKPTVVGEVDKQIRARIDACIPQSTFRPTVGESALSNCYFDHSTRYTYTDKVHWTLVDYPKVELRVTEDRNAGRGGVSVHTTTPGHATITYEYSFNVLEPRVWSPTSATEEINPRGDVVVDAGKIVWVG